MKYCIASIAMLLCFSVYAKRVDSATAYLVAEHFAMTHFRSAMQGGVVLSSEKGANAAFYLFHVKPTGFVLIAAEDRAVPVLAWSDESDFDFDSIPLSVSRWLGVYKHDISRLVRFPETIENRYTQKWQELLTGEPGVVSKSTSVAPMLTTRWNQNGHYNFLCPYDSTAKARVLTGCVATVMAQLMRYWQWPSHGIGFHAYDDNTYGVLSANFGHSRYNWSAMPASPTYNDSDIGKVMFQAGVSVNMDYGVKSSSSYVLAANCPIRYNAQFSLINYFCYKPSIRGFFRQDYNDNSWTTVLETELLAGRPVIYDGANDSEGHSFIADGFDNNNLMHFNWGWGGAFNGYFSIDSIVPDSISFMKSNTVLTGIEPDRTRSLIMGSGTISTVTPLFRYQPFTLTSWVINTGLNDFSGDVKAVLTGDAYPYFSQSVSLSHTLLPAGDSAELVFPMTGMAPGSYHVRLWYGATDTLVDSTADYANYDPVFIYGDSVNAACTVFPNPASDYCYISLNQSGATFFQMISSNGAKVAEGRIAFGQPVLALPVRSLADGLYWVALETPSGIQRMKIELVHGLH